MAYLIQAVGDDLAPTSLKDGRGEVVVIVVVVVFHLDLNFYLVDGLGHSGMYIYCDISDVANNKID